MADLTTPRAPLAPWDRPQWPSRFTAEETAIRVGHYKWLEMRIFELLGGWVAIVPEVGIKHRLGTHCYHHAFHAELWHKRLPELGEMTPERLTRPPTPEVAALFDTFGDVDLDSGHETIEKLVGLYRVVLPHLIAAYTFHLNNTSEVADAPTIRSLNLCLQDDLEEWREGEMMLQWLIEAPDQVDRAMVRQAELTRLVVAAGGILGPDSIGHRSG